MYVASVCDKCFTCYRRILQVFLPRYYICCSDYTRVLQAFVLNIFTCFRRMLQVFYLNITDVAVYVYIASVCSKCFTRSEYVVAIHTPDVKDIFF